MTTSKSTSRAIFVAVLLASTDAFMPAAPTFVSQQQHQPLHTQGDRRIVSSSSLSASADDSSPMEKATQFMAAFATTAVLSASLFLGAPAAFADDELAAKYGGSFDSSLIDQTCLVDKCSLQAKACLADDPSCRKGLTCTAKCLGDNSCITGCMARYGDKNLDNLLKCTIEDNDCIKIAILDGGADKFGEEPRSPAPTIKNFNYKTMEGSWYKVVGFNPNYDCYSCQRNTFSAPDSGNNMFISNNNKLRVDVEFSMAHLLPDGSPTPPTNTRENVKVSEDDGLMYGSKSIGFNDYETHEVMVFDKSKNPLENLVLNRGSNQESTYARTAHSEGEMFGLKFWENWYIIGENDNADDQDFKFVYYNGKTRQNTYEGAFVYARNRELSPESMKKVYAIANDAGMNPDQFCKIRNGCFSDDTVVTEPATGLGSPSNPFRGILASTKVSQLLGVEPVAAEQTVKRTTATSPALQQQSATDTHRAWWYEVGDYLENPHRHFEAMDSLRITMEWPEDVKTP